MELTPTKSSIELNGDQLKMELELTIVVNEQTQKSEKLKLPFNLTECQTILEVSQYFVSGLVKSIVEQVAPALKVSLETPSLSIKSDTVEMHGKDLSNMLGAKMEKDHSQGFLHSQISEKAMGGKKFKKHPSRQMLKPPPVEPKKFEYKDPDSQEFEFTVGISSVSQQKPQASQQQSRPKSPEIPKKRKMPNIKF